MTQTGRSSGLDVSGIPRIIGWGRPLSTTHPAPYCGVIDLDSSGAVVTACRGRWSTAEPMHYVEGRDRDRDNDGRVLRKCGGCDPIAKLQRTEAGLSELRSALVVETRPFPSFDFSDVDTGDYLLPDLGGEG